jgi:hypothetical protein
MGERDSYQEGAPRDILLNDTEQNDTWKNDNQYSIIDWHVQLLIIVLSVKLC